MKTLDNHLENIKNIQFDANSVWQQGLNNIIALHEASGGKTDNNGDFILKREDAIRYFANRKHLIDYGTIDPI